MQTLAKLLDRHAPHGLVRKTWGDALHVVTDDAASAAHIVSEIHHTLEQHRLRDDGVLGDLELRIAAHYAPAYAGRSEEHTSELQSLMRISYAVFCLKKKTQNRYTHRQTKNI